MPRAYKKGTALMAGFPPRSSPLWTQPRSSFLPEHHGSRHHCARAAVAVVAEGRPLEERTSLVEVGFCLANRLVWPKKKKPLCEVFWHFGFKREEWWHRNMKNDQTFSIRINEDPALPKGCLLVVGVLKQLKTAKKATNLWGSQHASIKGPKSSQSLGDRSWR